MEEQYQLKDDGSFVINDYNQAYPFSNFLPGVAGVWGIPVWAFYVNRGQAVISFGLENKDTSIAEFWPANKAYALVSSIGFRTFIKINGQAKYEPFHITHPHGEEDMTIRSASLEIEETNRQLGLRCRVKYFTLPNCPVGGLVRVLRVRNISNEKTSLEILDGHSRIIPFGTRDVFLKYLSRTVEAWMRCGVRENLAIFRLIVDPEDVSETKYVEGANFNYSFWENNGVNSKPYLIIDPEAVFLNDTSYSSPLAFWQDDFKVPLRQIDCGKTPCSFSHFKWDLAAGEERTFYSVFGTALNAKIIEGFLPRLRADFIEQKDKENEELTEKIKSNAFCVSAKKEFDQYIKCSYLDNVLRGGYPYAFGGSKDIYYVFSRKHGDLERDYNKFRILPSYFSEGEANYRDINQNRRMDLFFNPFIGKNNIVYFLNLIKIDGYNPLVVNGEKLFFKAAAASKLLNRFGVADKKIIGLMIGGFHLGEFFKLAEAQGLVVKRRDELAAALVVNASRMPYASFGEGYWIDHWRYNLDLIESYLLFYPEKALDLFLSKDYLFWDDEYRVNPRKGRYQIRNGKVYQGHGVENVQEKADIISRRPAFNNFLRTKTGKIYKTNLTAKILSLVLNKAASLDSDGIGVEMEADKPGWCDSLNGLPMLFGSSLCETIDLKRACLILIGNLKILKDQKVNTIPIAEELFSFMKEIERLLDAYNPGDEKRKDYLWWDKAGTAKEKFRKKTFYHLTGKEIKTEVAGLILFLTKLAAKLNTGIEKAHNKKDGMYSTYFMYEVKKWRGKDKNIFPLEFERKPLPYSLEGVVGLLRVDKRKELYAAVKKSPLYDRKLKMYRLNDSLAGMPLEIGRSRVFVPGWLENESIWLHMEYKYLLEILKSGWYKEFFEDFYNCCVCFFPAQTYGRNILENSSFIVSSCYPDDKLWGKGFVARLSGATAELLNIWIIMAMGRRPFFTEADNNLFLKFSPL